MAKNPNRVKAGKKSKAKGSKFQRDIAAFFAEWSGFSFRSVPASGALRWNDSFWAYGDLVPPEWFAFTIECKHHADVRCETFLDKQDSIIADWHQQAASDSERAAAAFGYQFVPLLVWKRDRTAPRISMPTGFYEELFRDGSSHRHMQLWISDDSVFTVMNLKDLLENTTYRDLVDARSAYFEEWSK